MDPEINKKAEVYDSVIDENSKVFYKAFVKKSHLHPFVVVRDFSRIENSVLHYHSDVQRYAMMYNVEMGDYSYVGRNFTGWHCKIGKYCSISWNVSIGGANHDYRRLTQHALLYAGQFGFLESNQVAYNRFDNPCEVGNDVWIGCNAVVCRNVKIGDGAVIAAGAVVTKDVEPYTIVAGVPAKIIGRRCSKDIAEKLCNLQWWNIDSEILKENFNLLQSTLTEETISQLEQLKNS